MTSMEDYVAQASSASNGQLLLLIAIAGIMGLGKGGVPGLATVATAATVVTAPSTIPGGLGYAVALQVPILFMMDAYAAWLHSEKLDWPTVRVLLAPSFVGMILGQVIDRRMTDSAARILVGAILLSMLALRVHKQVLAAVFPVWSERRWGPAATAAAAEGRRGERKLKAKLSEFEGGEEERKELEVLIQQQEHDIESSSGSNSGASPPPSLHQQQQQQQPRPLSSSSLGWAIAVGLIGGAATMLTNSMGPILNVYLLSVRDLSPPSYIGTRAVFFCFLNLGKIPLRFISGTLGWVMIPLALGLGLVSVGGVFFARPIMMGMREETFVRLELAVVAFAGLRLLWMGLHQG